MEQILAQIVQSELRHVVLTGGEPMLFSELVPLCRELQEGGFHITIETAGTLYLPLACDLMSISPKMSNSTPSLESAASWHDRHETTRVQLDVVHGLIKDYPHQLKFVVGCCDDVQEVRQYLQQLPTVPLDRVWLMPEGTDPRRLAEIETWLRPHCRAWGVQFCPRRQIEWYGDQRGT